MKASKFSRKNLSDPETERLKQELRDAQDALQQAYHSLDQVVDPELVESWVYQISAIQARCNYLIRAIKARCGVTPAARAEEEVSWT